MLIHEWDTLDVFYEQAIIDGRKNNYITFLTVREVNLKLN
jgi:hypothetical protein